MISFLSWGWWWMGCLLWGALGCLRRPAPQAPGGRTTGSRDGSKSGAWGWDSLDLLRPNVVHGPVIPELFQFARLSVAPKSIPREEYKKQ